MWDPELHCLWLPYPREGVFGEAVQRSKLERGRGARGQEGGKDRKEKGEAESNLFFGQIRDTLGRTMSYCNTDLL